VTQPSRPSLAESAAPVGRATPAGVPGHDVQFYHTETFLTAAVVKFLAEGLRAGQPQIVIATPSHRRQFVAALRAAGVAADDILGTQDGVWLDARDTLDAFMEGGLPNRERFAATVGDIFEMMLEERNYLVVRAYGEMVDLLWQDRNVDGAVAVEELWNELAAKYAFSLLCGYALGGELHTVAAHDLDRVCAQHTLTLPFERPLDIGDLSPRPRAD
jgi:hypothetical protein